MDSNFSCIYESVGGTYCYHYEKDIIDDLGNNECESCEMNNVCEYCDCRVLHLIKECTKCEYNLLKD